MPKAAIDEHSYPWTREHDVWTTSALGQHADMFSITETPLKKSMAKLLLENAFLLAIRDH